MSEKNNFVVYLVTKDVLHFAAWHTGMPYKLVRRHIQQLPRHYGEVGRLFSVTFCLPFVHQDIPATCGCPYPSAQQTTDDRQHTICHSRGDPARNNGVVAIIVIGLQSP